MLLQPWALKIRITSHVSSKPSMASPPKRSSSPITADAYSGSSRLVEISPQKPQMLRGYLIRLTREYTDGGMDSHAEEEKR
jgi:hypothetical protein